jgi:hypothetical protein
LPNLRPRTSSHIYVLRIDALASRLRNPSCLALVGLGNVQVVYMKVHPFRNDQMSTELADGRDRHGQVYHCLAKGYQLLAHDHRHADHCLTMSMGILLVVEERHCRIFKKRKVETVTMNFYCSRYCQRPDAPSSLYNSSAPVKYVHQN